MTAVQGTAARTTGVAGVLRRAVRATGWYVRELLGENAYDRYLAVHRRRHPGTPVMSRREFERARTDRAEQHPTSRCC